MALFDEEDLFDMSEQMGEAEEEGGLTDVAALRERLFQREQESASEAAKQRQVLEQIQQAKLKLLQAPSRKEALMGLAQKLTAPRERTDPRFFERQNLYTFLRDIGEYGAEQKQAERERQAAIAELQEKYATGALKSAEAGQTRAQQLAAQYLREPRTTTAAARTSEFERLIADLPPEEQARMRRQRAEVMASRAPRAEKEEKTGPEGEAAQILWATETLANTAASPAQKDAARRILERKEPRDVRIEKIKGEKNAKSYLSRIKEQNQFTIPDIQSAIDQIDEGGSFAAGNVSRILRGLPIIGQPSTDLEKTLIAIKSRIGFDKMDQLKKESPTGSTGLGAVSNKEQDLLASIKGSVDVDISPPKLRATLVRLKDFYEKESFEILDRETGIRGLSGIDETLSMIGQGGAEPAAPAASAAPMVDLDAIRKERERRNALRKAGGG